MSPYVDHKERIAREKARKQAQETALGILAVVVGATVLAALWSIVP